MLFAYLTLFVALMIAGVAAWFSVVGIMTIFSGAAVQVLVMAASLECGKLITASWLYRNWKESPRILKIPLVLILIVLMGITSLGIFGVLSKAHFSQGTSTVDNSSKIARLDEQIQREKNTIADDEKVILQLDDSVKSLSDMGRIDKSVALRKTQDSQRKELRNDIANSHKTIDSLSNDKLSLQSDLNKLNLEIGPIRYISELIYSSGDPQKNVESAVKIMIMIIVSVFDPLAVILLIAANHTLMNLKKEPIEEEELPEHIEEINSEPELVPVTTVKRRRNRKLEIKEEPESVQVESEKITVPSNNINSQYDPEESASIREIKGHTPIKVEGTVDKEEKQPKVQRWLKD
jgi:hypothetical protein